MYIYSTCYILVYDNCIYLYGKENPQKKYYQIIISERIKQVIYMYYTGERERID